MTLVRIAPLTTAKGASGFVGYASGPTATQSTVASHLRELADAGVVKKRRQGKRTYYRIGDTAVLQRLDMAAVLDS